MYHSPSSHVPTLLMLESKHWNSIMNLPGHVLHPTKPRLMPGPSRSPDCFSRPIFFPSPRHNIRKIPNCAEIGLSQYCLPIMQSELAYMSLEWARRNDSCGRLQGVQLSASLSSSKSGLTETLNQVDSETSNASLITSWTPLK